MNLSFFVKGLHNFFQIRPVHRPKLKRISWLRFISFLILSSMLISPAGMIPVQAAWPAPNLLSPGDGDTIDAVEAPPVAIPEFSWEPVPGATSYRLQVSSDIAFTTTAINQTTPNTTFTPTSVSVLPDGHWFWRVRVDAPAPIGDYSSTWSFTKRWATSTNIPTLISPADSATVDFYDAPSFSWSPVIGAAKYKFRVYGSSGSCLTAADNAVTLETTYQPNTKWANGTLFWCVIAVDNGGHNSLPSLENSFIANYNPAITLLAPDDYATPTFTPEFRWSAVAGAQIYRLQYSTDNTFNSAVVQKDTRSTTYTPVESLQNDKNYYWRVRVLSGNSTTDWTPYRTFVKQWYIKPVLLTPVNTYQDQRFPLFSWTPVPGAARYFIEISRNDPNFTTIYDSGYTTNTNYTPSRYEGALSTYSWRVTPYDGSGNKGKVSDTASYVSYYNSIAPEQVYPLYYYPPDTYSGYPGLTTNPHDDRTVSEPIFIWHRVYKPAGDPNAGQIYADGYRLQVSTDPTFSSPFTNPSGWTVDTQNLTAVPIASNPFTPLEGTDYFWRVCALVGSRPWGACSSPWSQVWRTRFDLTKGLPLSTGAFPTLIRPTDGFEFAEQTPLLEWFPPSGSTTYNASSYDVQISLDEDFSSIVDSATVPYPAYIPTSSLAQRSLGSVDFGIYYWRVRTAGSGSWSVTRRFQIAAQSQWKNIRALGDAGNQLQIGSDPLADATLAAYDLTDLRASQSSSNWYLGFHVPAYSGTDVTYALYLDLDHQPPAPGLPAFFDARGYSVTTNPNYSPEYAIYVLQEAGVFQDSKTYLYRWNGSGWNTVSVFGTNGCHILQNGNYIELQMTNTAINYQDTTGSYTISLFSLPAGNSGTPKDSVPSDPNVPGVGGTVQINRFASVTERMNLSMPPNNAGVDPTTYSSVLPFLWDWPVLSPWAGAIMKVYLDPGFTSQVATYTLISDTSYWAQSSHAWGTDFTGDNTYYWRIQPTYTPTHLLGAWSQGWRFERQGFIAQNLHTTVTYAAPTFSWDMVEGAEYYDLQVNTDPGFGSSTNAFTITTRQNSYTDINTLKNATLYYWHVKVHRNGGPTADWSTTQSFTLTLPGPNGLTPSSGAIVNRAPTLCWNPQVISPPASPAVFAAYEYRVQVSTDPTFSSIFDNIDTEQRCWTPKKGYPDGTYYWHVASIDGNGKVGNYTAYMTFIKQYPVSTLVSPLGGAAIDATPTFIWTAVNGAAKYKLEVSQVANFSGIYDTVTTDCIRYTPTKTYAINKTYYWRLAIIDVDGKIGPYTGATIILDPYPYNIYLPFIKR